MGNQLTCSEALRALVDKLDVIHADPRYAAVWTMSSIHGCPYAGPDYAVELAAARVALAAVPATLTACNVWAGIRLRLWYISDEWTGSGAERRAEDAFFALAGAAGVPAVDLEPVSVRISEKGEVVLEWSRACLTVVMYANFDRATFVVLQREDDGNTVANADLRIRQVAALLWPHT